MRKTSNAKLNPWLIWLLPAAITPYEVLPSQMKAMGLLVAITYTLTFPQYKRPLDFVRLLLAIPCAYYFYDHGYGPYELNRGIDVGPATVAVYGWMRLADICVVGIWDKYPSVWVRVSDGKRLPLPTTFRGRLAYAVDLATTIRGISWFKDTVFDYCPRSIVEMVREGASTTRFQFIRTSILYSILGFFLMDIVDTIQESAHVNTSLLFPITQASPPYPMHKQLLYGFCVCSYIIINTYQNFFTVVIAAVALGSNPSSWPPPYNKPFTATSLSDFWARRWHVGFRRSFDRMARLFEVLIPSSAPEAFKRVVRISLIFAFTCVLHLILMNVSDSTPEYPHPSFFDVGTMTFYLSQPLGLFIESFLIFPLTASLPPSMRSVTRRIWPWIWLFWTGRYWADVFSRRGFWSQRLVGLSVVRGVWKGEWLWKEGDPRCP
jgi:hypothetical protein